MPSNNQTEVTEVPFFVIEERRKKERSDRDLLKTLKIFVLPIFTLLSFLGVVLLLIIPKVAEIFGNLDEIGLADQKVQTLSKLTADLRQLSADSAQITNDLSTLNQVVPTGTAAVTEFQQKVIELAQGRSLQVNQAVIGEQVLTQNDTGSSKSSLSLIEVPAEFTLVGGISDVKSFINDVLELDDFVLIGEMRLTESSTTLWTLQITLLKYQFPADDAVENIQAIYSNISPTAKLDAEVMEIIRK